MTYLATRDFFAEVALGNVTGWSAVNKFGHNTVVSTTLAAVSHSGMYMTPIAATSLEIVSASASDAAAGIGAQEVTIEGIDLNWDYISQTVEMDGLTPVALDTDLMRMFRATVSRTGTYSTLTTTAQVGEITIQETGGGAVWGVIPLINVTYGQGQTEIGFYTVPTGKQALGYLRSFSVDTNKAVNIYLMRRDNADDVLTPFAGIFRVQESFTGIEGVFTQNRPIPLGPFAARTDIGFFAETTTGTAAVSISFDIILIDV